LSWLNKIFSKEEEKPEETKISLAEVEDFLKSKIEKDSEPLKPIKEEYEKLKAIATIMHDQLNILEQATYPERTYPIIISKSVGSRKGFVSKMNILIKQLHRSVGEDTNSILNFYDETDKLVNNLNEETIKEYASVKILFEKEGREVVHSFRQIFEINKKLGDIIKEFRDSNSKFLKAKKLVYEISKMKEELEKNEIGELDGKLKETQDKIDRIENEIKKLIESEEWNNFLVMQKTKEEIKISMQNKKYEFIQNLSLIEIPLKKYNWYAKNKVLDYYIQKSFEPILFEDPNGEVFTSAIRDMKIKIIEGEMDLKNSDKFLDVINKMIKDKTVIKTIEEYLRLSEDLKKQEQKIASEETSKIKNNLENDISVLKKYMEELKDEKKRTEEKRKNVQEDRERKLKDLEHLINSYSDKKILLQVN